MVGIKRIKRLKILPPTLRERERYIRFKIVSEEKIVFSDLEQALTNYFLDYYGEFLFSQFSLKLIKNLWKEKKQDGVIKCNHLSVPWVIAGLGIIDRIGDQRIIFKIVKISGTLKKVLS